MFQAKKLMMTSAAVLAALGSAASYADGNGYAISSDGKTVKNGFGQCWRTGYWAPSMATAECDPDLVPKPKPVPVAEAPAPAPAPAAAPAPAPAPVPVAEKVTISADALFDFDKAVLRQEGKSKLDDFAAKAKNLDVEVIMAVGHADHIGSDKYNQKLSEKRAVAVKQYLIDKGIEPNRVYTEGKGEAQPTTTDQCKGLGKDSGKNKKLVACLQPDRRVELEVVGTKK